MAGGRGPHRHPDAALVAMRNHIPAAAHGRPRSRETRQGTCHVFVSDDGYGTSAGTDVLPANLPPHAERVGVMMP